MSFLDWVRRWYGERIDYPGGVGGQCVDAANAYLAAVWKASPVRANAVDWPNAVIPGFARTFNTPTNAPPAGSIVWWEPDVLQLGIGPMGHLAIVLAASQRTMLTVDQNWAGQQVLMAVPHSYIGVRGWHEPRASVMAR